MTHIPGHWNKYASYSGVYRRLHWIGLDWIGLHWIGLDWIALDWIGLDWIGLDWIAKIDSVMMAKRMFVVLLLVRICE